MAYELFKRTRARVESPTLSIIPDGRIGINAAAARIFSALRVKAVQLLWDKARYKLALRPASRANENAFTVTIMPTSHSGTIRAKSFLNHIGWTGRKRETVSANWNERERLLEAVLPSDRFGAGPTGISKR